MVTVAALDIQPGAELERVRAALTRLEAAAEALATEAEAVGLRAVVQLHVDVARATTRD